MFQLSIVFGPSATMWGFLFSDKEKAENARTHAIEFGITNPDSFMIEDEFGQMASFGRNTIIAVMLEDVDLTGDARIAKGIFDLKLQNKADAAGQADPEIKAIIQKRRMAGMMGSGPGGNGLIPPPGPWPRQ